MPIERMPWLARKARRERLRSLRELVGVVPSTEQIRRWDTGTDKEREAITALWTANPVWPDEAAIAAWILANP